MTTTGLSSYSTTPASNSSIAGLSIAEGSTLPSTVNNGMRQQMADLAVTIAGLHNARDYGATADGTTDDTTALAAAVTAMPAKGVLFLPALSQSARGEYLTTGITMPISGEVIATASSGFKAASGATILLNFPGDATAPQDSAQPRSVRGVEFDGNGTDFYTYRPGSIGLKFGDSTYPQVHPITEDCFFHTLELGQWHYSSQEAEDRHSKHYRCKWGKLIQADPYDGGATASITRMVQHQLCHVGAVYDNIAFFALATTATMANSSTALSSVGDVTDVAVGMKITGPGITAGTTISAVSAGSITLSQTTTATAAGDNIPVLIRNANRYTSGGGYDTGWIEEGPTFQANGVAAFACFGFNLTIINGHFETNNQPAIATGTSTISQSARVIPNRCITISDSKVRFISSGVGETTNMAVINGSIVEFHGSQLAVSVEGDYTSKLRFFGHSENLVGQWTAPVERWPDSATVAAAAGWCAYGVATQVRTRAIPNAYTQPNPRLPLMTGGAGGVVASYVQDATYGRATKVQFAASVGGYGTHYVASQWVAAGVAVGDWVLWSRIMWADRYTQVTLRGTSGSGSAGGQFTFWLAPYPQRIVTMVRVNTADSGTLMHVWPVDDDAPAIYCQNEMQVVAPDGDARARADISAVLREGLFNDNTDDGALVYSAAYTPPSLATLATSTSTVTVNGAMTGDAVSVAFSGDLLGEQLTARVSATNTVEIRASNPTSGTLTPSAGTILVRVHTA